MALTKTQVSNLYVAIFNRASEGSGNTYWQDKGTAAEIADAMLATSDAATYFGSSLDTNQAFIEHVYLNTLNKTAADDAAGIAYWVGLLEGGTSRGSVVAGLTEAVASYSTSTDATTLAAYNQFTNRVAVSDNMADTVDAAPTDYATSTSFGGDLVVTDDASTVTTAATAITALATTEDAAKTVTYTIAADVASVTEGSSVVLTVTASEALSVTSTTLNYQIAGVEVAGGTASPAADLGKVTGEVTIAAGATTGTITLTPTDDGVTEGFEGFTVTLLDDSFATVATSGNVVIKDGAEAGTSQSLTTSTDTLSGGLGNDTFNSVIVAQADTGTTLQAGDTISAGAGTDVLNVSISSLSTAALTTQAYQATDLEKILVSNFDTNTDDSEDSTVDTALVTGLTTVGLSSSGATGDTIFTGMTSIVDAEMKNGAADLTVTYGSTIIAGTTDSQNLTVANLTAGTFTTNGIETLNITTATAASILTNVSATGLTTINVAGDQALTVSTALTTDAVNASTMTGALTMSIGANASSEITGGTGDDVLDITTNLGASDEIDGGAGTDTLKISVGNSTIDATATTGELVGVSNVEKLQINSTNDAAELDLTSVTGVSNVQAAANVKTVVVTASTGAVNPTTVNYTLNGTSQSFTADASGTVAADKVAFAAGLATDVDAISGFTASTDGTDTVTITATSGEVVEILITDPANTTFTESAYNDVTFTDMAAGTIVDVYSADKVTANLADASGTADATTFNLATVAGDKGFDHTIGEISTTETETITIDSSGLTATYTNTLTTLTADSKVTTLNITGDSNLTIGTIAGTTLLATVDASTFTADLSIDGTAGTSLDQTITTGSGNDTIDMDDSTLMLDADDTINGGSNTVLSTGVMGEDTLTADTTGSTAVTGALNVSNVERLNLTNTGATIIDATAITGATEIAVLTNTTSTTVTGLAAGVAVGVGHKSTDGDTDGKFDITLADETGSSDALTFNFNDTAVASTNTVELVATAIEDVTVSFNTTDSSLANTTLDVDSLNATKITVTGADADVGHALSLNGGTTLDSDTTEVDASAYKGILTVSASAAVATTISAGGDVANVITGSSGNDTITIGSTTNQDMTIDGNGGTDTLNITFGDGAQIMNSITDVDTINIAIANSADITTDANATDLDGINEASAVNFTGGNSLSSVTLGGTTDTLLGEGTSVSAVLDFSGFNGDLTNATFDEDDFDNAAATETVQVIGTAQTSDKVTASYDGDSNAAVTVNMQAVETFVVDLGDSAVETVLNMAAVTGLTTIDFTDHSSESIEFNNLATGITIDATTDNATATTVEVKLADVTGSTDAQTFEAKALGADDNLAIVIADVETVTVKADSALQVDLDLSAVSMTATSAVATVNFTGANDIELIALNADVTTLNASGMSSGGSVVQTGRSATAASTVTGSDGADTFIMMHKDDAINGGTGADTLDVNYTSVIGGMSIDLSNTTDQISTFNGASNSAVQVGFQHVDLSGYTGNGAEVIANASGSTIVGSASTDSITGGTGADTIVLSLGDDAIVAGATDTLKIINATNGGLIEDNDAAGNVIDLAAGTIVWDGASVTGNSQTISTDVIIVDASTQLDADVDLTITGNTGDNVISSGAGADTIAVSTGTDTIVWQTGTVAEIDTITQFTAEADLLSFDADLLSAVTATGALSATNYAEVTVASAGATADADTDGDDDTLQTALDLLGNILTANVFVFDDSDGGVNTLVADEADAGLALSTATGSGFVVLMAQDSAATAATVYYDPDFTNAGDFVQIGAITTTGTNFATASVSEASFTVA